MTIARDGGRAVGLTRTNGAMRQVDRFIPSRSALDLDVAHYNLSREGGESEREDAVKEIKSPAKVRGDDATTTRTRERRVGSETDDSRERRDA